MRLNRSGPPDGARVHVSYKYRIVSYRTRGAGGARLPSAICQVREVVVEHVRAEFVCVVIATGRKRMNVRGKSSRHPIGFPNFVSFVFPSSGVSQKPSPMSMDCQTWFCIIRDLWKTAPPDTRARARAREQRVIFADETFYLYKSSRATGLRCLRRRSDLALRPYGPTMTPGTPVLAADAVRAVPAACAIS